MDCKAKAEEFFELIANRRKTLVEIPLNCSQGETGTLLYLTFVKDNISASKLAESLEVSLPRITSVLNSLESKKLIERKVDSEDKRKTVVSITDVGKKLVLSKKEEAVEKISKIIERLDEKDINQYIALARKIGKIIDEVQE